MLKACFPSGQGYITGDGGGRGGAREEWGGETNRWGLAGGSRWWVNVPFTGVSPGLSLPFLHSGHEEVFNFVLRRLCGHVILSHHKLITMEWAMDLNFWNHEGFFFFKKNISFFWVLLVYIHHSKGKLINISVVVWIRNVPQNLGHLSLWSPVCGVNWEV